MDKERVSLGDYLVLGQAIAVVVTGFVLTATSLYRAWHQRFGAPEGAIPIQRLIALENMIAGFSQRLDWGREEVQKLTVSVVEIRERVAGFKDDIERLEDRLNNRGYGRGQR